MQLQTRNSIVLAAARLKLLLQDRMRVIETHRISNHQLIQECVGNEKRASNGLEWVVLRPSGETLDGKGTHRLELSTGRWLVVESSSEIDSKVHQSEWRQWELWKWLDLRLYVLCRER